MLKCKKCGRSLDVSVVEGTVECECGAKNHIVSGKVITADESELFDVTGAAVSSEQGKQSEEESKESSQGSEENSAYEGKDADEETVERWFGNYRQYFNIENVEDVVKDFCAFTGLAPDSVIQRGRFKYLWDKYEATI